MKKLRLALHKFWIDLHRCMRGIPGALQDFHKPSVIALVVLVVSLAFTLFWHDDPLLDIITAPTGRMFTVVAEKFSYWGDYVPGTLPLVAVIWLAGLFWNKVNWRRAAMACLLAATFAGIFNNTLRLSLGRPRPAANLPDGFYGFQTSAKFHGFPSGHSATSFGTATALLVTVPQIGVPVTLIASTVGWSRMRLERHHPSDVFVGGSIGIFVGLTLGYASKRRKDTAPAEQEPINDLLVIESPAISTPLLVPAQPLIPAEVSGREKIPQNRA